MFDDFLYKWRFYIGGGLIALIVIGLGILGWDKFIRSAQVRENQIMAELKAQNEALRLQLAGQQQVAGAATENPQSDKININTADAAELDKLPNIGPARARDIISYRETHGGFKTIEEIKNIKGIGDKSFESMKDLITVGN